MVETPPDNDAEPESYLDPLLLQSPSLALNQSVREEFRMMDELKTMLRTVQAIGDAKSPAKLTEIDRHRGHLESIGKRLKIYLGQIADDSLSPADVRWKFILMDYVQELAAVGILIHRDLADSTLHQAKSKIRMPPEHQQDIASVVKKTLARMERAPSILMSPDAAQAEAYISEKEQLSHWCRQARRSHHEKNPIIQDSSWETTSDYLDQLNILRRINSHLTSAAYALARPQSAALEASKSTADATENKGIGLY